jgi:hypothetical protein
MRVIAIFISFFLILPAGFIVEAQDSELTTIDGQIRTFLISGTLLITSILLKAVVFLLSLSLRGLIETLSRIGMEKEMAREIIIEIINRYISGYLS